MKKLSGTPASPGIALGPTFLFREIDLSFERRNVSDSEAEWERLKSALETAREELQEVQAKAEEESGAEEASIFRAHALMLEDPELVNKMQTVLEEEQLNAEAALKEATESYAEMLEALDDEYLSARAADVRDVANRVLRILLDVAESPVVGLDEPSIILARDLTPSDTVLLDKALVLGFCIAEGGRTSHTAILARSLGLPAVVGAGAEVLKLEDGTPAVLDGSEGVLVVEPEEGVESTYRDRKSRLATVLKDARERADAPAVSSDGQRVEVVANIGNVEGAEAAQEAGAEGVGLLRTEFLYLERSSLPDEEEQFEAYRAIVETFGDQPVILRTLDVGGDKELPYLELDEEMNPFLGVRAIRLCLQRPDLFKPQLRAVLRAGVVGDLKVMFPMVATLQEVRAARKLLEECRVELQEEGVEVAQEMEIGVMIEVPGAALMADQLAEEVDFFSIGTNDLSQYVMAADRTNSNVSDLMSAFHPAVLRLVADVIAAAHDRGKWVGLCGELAGEPLAIPILLGLGLDEFSMNPPAIPLAKQIIRDVSIEACAEVARDALQQESPEDVKRLVRERVPAADVR